MTRNTKHYFLGNSILQQKKCICRNIISWVFPLTMSHKAQTKAACQTEASPALRFFLVPDIASIISFLPRNKTRSATAKPLPLSKSREMTLCQRTNPQGQSRNFPSPQLKSSSGSRSPLTSNGSNRGAGFNRPVHQPARHSPPDSRKRHWPRSVISERARGYQRHLACFVLNIFFPTA